MRIAAIAAGIFVVQTAALYAQSSVPTTPPAQLVREVVYNELSDHAHHGYWKYWIERRAQGQTEIDEQVETLDGPITRTIRSNGHPLDADAEREQRGRLNRLISSPSEQARHRQEYAEDENRIARIVALLPEAFLYEYEGEESGCHKLRFHPNPAYPVRSIEARVFHAMSGELWIDARSKRLARLDGRLDENVDFGFGLLGRLYKGGWFRLERVQVGATDWKTQRLEVHMNGRAMLFKTIARETSEVRGGFAPVPAAMNLPQGARLIEPKEGLAAFVGPQALTVRH